MPPSLDFKTVLIHVEMTSEEHDNVKLLDEYYKRA